MEWSETKHLFQVEFDPNEIVYITEKENGCNIGISTKLIRSRRQVLEYRHQENTDNQSSKVNKSKLIFQKVDIRSLLPSYETLDNMKKEYFYNASDIIIYGELLPQDKTWHVFAIRVEFSETDFQSCPVTFEISHWHKNSNSMVIHMSNDLKNFMSNWNIECVPLIGKMSITECLEKYVPNLTRGCPLYGYKSQDNIWEGIVLIGKDIFVKVLNSQHNYSKDQIDQIRQKKVDETFEKLLTIIETPKIKHINIVKDKKINKKKNKLDQDFESAWSKFTDPDETMLVNEMMLDNEVSQKKNIENYVKWRLSKPSK